jgi:hypothetical protein
LAAAQGSSNRQEWQEEGEDGGVTGEGDVMMMRGCDDVNCTLRIYLHRVLALCSVSVQAWVFKRIQPGYRIFFVSV